MSLHPGDDEGYLRSDRHAFRSGVERAQRWSVDPVIDVMTANPDLAKAVSTLSPWLLIDTKAARITCGHSGQLEKELPGT